MTIDDLNVAVYEWALLGYHLEHAYVDPSLIRDMYAVKMSPEPIYEVAFWTQHGSVMLHYFTPLMYKAFQGGINAKANSNI